jgi:aminotransferase
LSSLIVSGQLTRAAALEQLASPLADESSVRHDIRFVAKKLGIGADTLLDLIGAAPVPHAAYPNQMAWHGGLTRLRGMLRSMRKHAAEGERVAGGLA